MNRHTCLRSFYFQYVLCANVITTVMQMCAVLV